MLDISRIINQLNAAGVRCSIVGGVAVALHGAVRGTVDLDIVIEHSLEQFVACDKALRAAGLSPRLPVTAEEIFKFRKEYVANRNLIAWSFYNTINPMEVVDVIITHDLKLMRSIKVKYGLQRLPILSLEGLINMKKASGRPQDLEDIKMLSEIKNGKKK